jgi:hypothetical protein
MLLGQFWMRDAKVFHDWGNNIIVTGYGVAERKPDYGY